MAAARNPYLRWLDGTGDLPMPMRPTAFAQAVRHDLQALRAATEALIEQPNWTRYQAWRAIDVRLVAMEEVMLTTSPFARGDDLARRKALEPLFIKRRVYRQDVADSTVPDEARRWMVAPQRSAAERSELAAQLLRWTDALRLPAQRETRRLALRQEVREQAHARRMQEEAVDLPEMDLRDLPGHLARSIRAHEGRLPRHQAEEALAHLTDEGAREVVWTAMQELPMQPKHVSELLQARHAEAQSLGLAHHAARMFRTHAVGRPQTVARLLLQVGEGLAPEVLRQQQRLERAVGDEEGSAVDTTPWNHNYLRQKAVNWERHIEPPPVGTFPVLPTLHRVVSDLLQVGGWSAQTLPLRHGVKERQVWQWTVRHDDGRMAELWVAPYLPQASTDAFGAAFVSPLRETWAGRRRRSIPTAFLGLQRDINERDFDVQDLVYLSHEMGHVLHLFAMPGRAPLEWIRSPLDMGELPSQLLERIARCPDQLARWAQPTTPSTRTRAYWEPRVRPDNEWLFLVQEEVHANLLDLFVHTRDPERVHWSAIDARLRKTLGLPASVEGDRSAERAILWGDYAGAMSCYLLDQLLVDAVLPKDATASDVEATYTELLGVFAEGVDPASFQRAWKAWQGETLTESLDRGQKRFVQRHLKGHKGALARTARLRKAR